MKQFSMIVLFALFAISGWAKDDLKPRLVVCTDIAPADVEPDDMESMVRLMAYADCFEIEALITSVGWNCDPYPKEWAEYLTRVIEAYRKDVPNLMRRSGQSEFLPMESEIGQQELGYWPSADYIKSRALMGSEHGGIKVIGEGNDSPGSELLIRLADEDDSRPIYVAAWGGANTLAQAIIGFILGLWTQSNSHSDVPLTALVDTVYIKVPAPQPQQDSVAQVVSATSTPAAKPSPKQAVRTASSSNPTQKEYGRPVADDHIRYDLLVKN